MSSCPFSRASSIPFAKNHDLTNRKPSDLGELRAYASLIAAIPYLPRLCGVIVAGILVTQSEIHDLTDLTDE